MLFENNEYFCFQDKIAIFRDGVKLVDNKPCNYYFNEKLLYLQVKWQINISEQRPCPNEMPSLLERHHFYDILINNHIAFNERWINFYGFRRKTELNVMTFLEFFKFSKNKFLANWSQEGF